MKKLTLLTLFCALATGVIAGDGWNESMTIFEHGTITDNNGFRIPAITTTSQGTVVAVADIRYGGLTGNTDMPKKVEFLIKTSNDGGSTWSEGTILAPAGGITDPSIVHDSNTGKTFLFGYNNDSNITSPNGKSDFFVYTSEDGGKTWEQSNLIADAGAPWTSEANIFHHNGKIYLAAKNENAQAGNYESKDTRVVYCTSDNGKTWEKVEETFLPDNIAKAETSTLALNDQVYLVGYSGQGNASWDRNDTFLTTNTGKTIKILDGDTYGYTSMAQDLDNLYILFETKVGVADVVMRRFDISSKEYANLNAQILDRGTYLIDIQDKLLSKQYVSGVYTNQSESGTEAVVELNNFKLGAFYRNTKENSDDVYRTIPYNLKETTLVLSQDNAFMQGDNIFIGYQAGKIEYSNKSKNDLNSFVMGYTFNKEMENDKIYTLALNGIYSNNKVKRNAEEGVGRTADFDSYSISMKNQFSKNISFTNMNNLKLRAGLNTTLFGHDGFEENGGIKTIDGGKWNNAKVDKSQNISNEIYIKTTLDQKIKLTDKSNIKLALDLGWKKELMDVDEWKDDFTVLDVEKQFATPVKKYDGGIGTATVSATFDLIDKLEVGIGYSLETDGESTVTGKVTYKL